MGVIQILNDQLTNQIAAGEVVERPASVVKELVENAIDADATRIVIRTKEGGISFIQVSDNGVGMDADDAVLAFSRHATSKLKKERDLFSIRTLGFRGEALPSIASIARVTLSTACSSEQPGVRVKVEGGEQQQVESFSRSRGTDVMVEDLFYNTPARLKYLKTVNTEIGHIADIVGRMAMAHPGISFVLTHQNRELLRTPGDGKLKHVLHAVYGTRVAHSLLSVSNENLDFRVYGYITRPEVTRASRSYMTFILNGRYIRSVPLTQSVLSAYDTLLPSKRYPIVTLAIEMDPKLVDVNVHPTKLEVRFSKERELCQLIERTIQEVFRHRSLVPSVDHQAIQKRRTVQESFFSTSYQRSSQPDVVKEAAAPSIDTIVTVETKDEKKQTEKNEQLAVEQVLPKKKADEDYRKKASFSHRKDPPLSKPEQSKAWPNLTPLAQIHGTYIVAQAEDGFYLIDQHAAHERIYYETFYRRLGEEQHGQQLLIVPITVECTAAEAKVFQQYIDNLNRWGLEIEPFGGSTFLVRSYPNWFPEEDARNLIDEVLEWIKSEGEVDTARLRDATAKMIACKAAIKANRHLRQDEMESLVVQLAQCENPYTCPHGRPIAIHFSTYELEKMFKRVM